MAKKDKPGIRRSIINFFLLVLLFSAAGFAGVKGVEYYLRHSPYLTIQSVVIDPDLQFINPRDVESVLKKNIFEVDLNIIQRGLSLKYPQASDLKVIRKFPHQLAIVAKKRIPFGVIKAAGRSAVIDDEGVILSMDGEEQGDLPMITGLTLASSSLGRGQRIEGKDLQIALRMIGRFKNEKGLAPYAIKEINVANLSKVEMLLDNDINVYLDRTEIIRKMKVLGVVFSEGQLDFKQVNYVDIRFNEPIIGKK